MPKILIIDDEKAIRNTLKDILTYEKFEVDEAADGVEGIKKPRPEGLILFFVISKCRRWMALKSYQSSRKSMLMFR